MLRVSLIGAGAVAKSHLTALRLIDEVRVVAFYDPLKERAEYLARTCDAVACDAYDEAIERAEAVWVCAPPGERRAPAVAAARAHRHLLLDKPIAATMEDARAIVAAADASRGKSMMCFSQRFDWRSREMKKRVESGDLGEVISVWSHGLQPDPSHESWRHDPRFACGFTVESMCHSIDLFRWFAGPIAGAYGIVSRTLPELPSFEEIAERGKAEELRHLP